MFFRAVPGPDLSAHNTLSYPPANAQDERGNDRGFWPAPSDGRSFVQHFIEVEDVDAAVARATDHGAHVMLTPQTLPEGEVMAILIDSEGLTFSVYSPEAAGQ